MFMRTSTHKRRIAELYETHSDIHRETVNRKNDIIARIETTNLGAQAKIKAYEKKLKIRTGYWKDSAGRWRSPDKHGKCVKASVVMTAQLRNEAQQAYGRRQAQADDGFQGVIGQPGFGFPKTQGGV